MPLFLRPERAHPSAALPELCLLGYYQTHQMIELIYGYGQRPIGAFIQTSNFLTIFHKKFGPVQAGVGTKTPKVYGDVTVSNLFPSANAGTRAAGDRIFLHENLTSYRKKIVNRANEMRRDGVLLRVWTLVGKIYVKDFTRR